MQPVPTFRELKNSGKSLDECYKLWLSTQLYDRQDERSAIRNLFAEYPAFTEESNEWLKEWIDKLEEFLSSDNWEEFQKAYFVYSMGANAYYKETGKLQFNQPD